MDKGLGTRIKECRNESGITAEALAELCNMDATYLRQIEIGKKTPSLGLFITLCNQLHASPSYLLQDSVQCNELSDIPELVELWKCCKPRQTAMAVSMLKEAIKHTNS